MSTWEIREGHCLDLLRALPDNTVDCVVTSPPYWRSLDFGTTDTPLGGDPDHAHHFTPAQAQLDDHKVYADHLWTKRQDTTTDAQRDDPGRRCACGAWLGQLSLEPSPQAFIDHLAQIFREVLRVLHPAGSLWLNLDDTWADTPYAPWGVRTRSLYGFPWRLAFALQADGWVLREDVVWYKPNGLKPEKPAGRTSRVHEYLFHFAKSEHPYADPVGITEPRADERGQHNLDDFRALAAPDWFRRGETRPRMSLWTLNKGAAQDHSAIFPVGLPDLCVLASTGNGGVCASCGTPYERDLRPGFDAGKLRREIQAADALANRRVRKNPLNGDPIRQLRRDHPMQDRGWQPDCRCQPARHRPALVLDPFAGTSTTGLAALLNGRDFLGLELNPEYAAMSRLRLGKVLAA